ncbi:MAG: hypothetical protein ABIC95_03470 [archaeon]
MTQIDTAVLAITGNLTLIGDGLSGWGIIKMVILIATLIFIIRFTTRLFSGKKGFVSSYGVAGGDVLKQAVKDWAIKVHSRAPKLAFFVKWFPLEERGFDGQISTSLWDIRYELLAHMNWMLRYEVIFSKAYHVFEQSGKADRIWSGYQTKKGHYDGIVSGTRTYDIAQKEMEYFKWGTPWEPDPDMILKELDFSPTVGGTHGAMLDKYFQYYDEMGKKKRLARIPEVTAKVAYMDMARYNLRFLKDIKDMLVDKGFIHDSMVGQQIDKNAKIKENLKSSMDTLTDEVNDMAKDFWVRMWRYVYLSHLRLLSEELHSAYQMQGVFPRGWKYARDDAKFDVYIGEIDKDEHWDGMLWDTPRMLTKWSGPNPYSATVGIGVQHGNDPNPGRLFDVDMRGWVMADLHRITFMDYPEAQGRTTPPHTAPCPDPSRFKTTRRWFFIRKIRDLKHWSAFPVHPLTRDVRKMSGHLLEGHQAEMLRWIRDEWWNYLENMETGMWMPRSRNFKLYTERHKKGEDYDFAYAKQKNIARRHEPKSGFEAYDREALKNPGFHFYWGRQDLTMADRTDARFPKEKRGHVLCPYPGISVFGQSKYLFDYIANKIDDVDRRVAALKLFPWSAREGEEEYFQAYDQVAKDLGIDLTQPTSGKTAQSTTPQGGPNPGP